MSDQDEFEGQETPAPKGGKAEAKDAERGSLRDVLSFEVTADQFPSSTPWAKRDKPTVVVMRTLTADEEIDAIRSANGAGERVNIELAKASLWKFDDKIVERENMQHEELWEQIGPRARNIVVFAFRQLWAASPEAVLHAQTSFRITSARC